MAERRLVFAIPGELATPTGGYLYDTRVIDGLRARGVAVEVLQLGDGFPTPDDDTRRVASEKLVHAAGRSLPIIVDGLALGALPEAAAAIARHAPMVALVHHPLAEEYGILPAEAARLRASEIAALSHARQIVVTSVTTARLLASDYAVDATRITVAPPGTDPVSSADDDVPRSGVLQLLSVGAISPRKGFDVLIEALAGLAAFDWQLTIVGDATHAPGAASVLRKLISERGVAGRATLTGAVPRKALGKLYRDANVFVLASHYEGYGMAYAEALSYGLPIIGTTGGAVAEVVPRGAGLLVPPGNVSELRDALARVMGDEALRRSMRRSARLAAGQLPRWEATVDIVAGVLGLRTTG